MRKLHKKLIIKVAFLTVILMSSTLILSSGLSNSSNPNIFSHTKAICNSTNFCQDYYIACENNKMKSISPITGAAVQFPKNWQDPRNETLRNKLC